MNGDDPTQVDETALAAWLQAAEPAFRGPLTLEKFKGGQSNPTYRLSTPDRTYVLRRKPFGPLAPGAHAVEREARAMTALGSAGFPVPRIHALCTDDSVIGSAFYVMEFVEGRIFWNSL
jgi:aminoglycoside phosphotransferase (APT) family kinase protein